MVGEDLTQSSLTLRFAHDIALHFYRQGNGRMTIWRSRGPEILESFDLDEAKTANLIAFAKEEYREARQPIVRDSRDAWVIVNTVMYHATSEESGTLGDAVAHLDVSFVRDDGSFPDRGQVEMLLRDWQKIDRFAMEVTLPAGTWWRAGD